MLARIQMNLPPPHCTTRSESESHLNPSVTHSGWHHRTVAFDLPGPSHGKLQRHSPDSDCRVGASPRRSADARRSRPACAATLCRRPLGEMLIQVTIQL